MISETLQLVLADAEEHMNGSIEHLRGEFKTIRAGKATPAMLENIRVDYYGSVTPLNQMASVSAPQSDMLVVQPWDRSALNDIEKAINQANLGLNPSNDGSMIRLPVPPLSEERRRDLVKTAKVRAEDAKIAIRNVRRNSKEDIKKTVAEETLSEDMQYEAEESLQQLTDQFIEKIDRLMDHKEGEIMEV